MNDIAEMTVLEIRDAVRSGQLKAVRVAETFLQRMNDLDPALRAVIRDTPDIAMQAAEAVDASDRERLGPLAGVPLLIKDNLQMLGTRTTAGSRILESYQSQFTATAVQKLVDAGAVILGKTNLDEFAMGSSTENSGFFTTKNPWDTDRIPGGSSGGSAAAVAARMAPGALGSDTGGSIRQPAAFCGVVGVKPTYGRISRYGLLAYGSSLDQIGPFARTVEDAALLTQVMSGQDSMDSTSSASEVPDFLSGARTGKDLKGLRIGRPAEYFGEGLDADVRAAIDSALEICKELGAEIVDITLPHSKYAVAVYYILATSEASSNLARYDGVHYGYRTGDDVDLIAMYSRSRREAFGDEVKRRIMLGTYSLSSGYYEAYYNKARQVRTLIRQDFDQAFEKCDLIAGPTTPTPAFRIGEKVDDPLQMYLSDIYTISVNLASLPGMSIPCGYTPENLPIGLQWIGRSFDEATLFRAGAAFQKATDFHRAKPPVA